MNILAELEGSARSKVARAVLCIAGSLLNSHQRKVLAHALGGKSPEQIEAMFDALLPGDEEMSGPMLPFLTEGKLHDFPSRVHDVVVLLLATYCMGDGMAGTGAEPSAAMISLFQLAGPTVIRNSRNISVGSETFYSPDAKGASPYLLKQAAARISPQTLWRVQNFRAGAASVGTGFKGLTERKGDMPATNIGGDVGVGQPRGVVPTDVSLGKRFPDEEKEAEDLE